MSGTSSQLSGGSPASDSQHVLSDASAKTRSSGPTAQGSSAKSPEIVETRRKRMSRSGHQLFNSPPGPVSMESQSSDGGEGIVQYFKCNHLNAFCHFGTVP